jgi:hypothetical protein
MIGFIDNVVNDILFHIDICFCIELVNFLLLSYPPWPVVRNGTSTLPSHSSARTEKIIQQENVK